MKEHSELPKRYYGPKGYLMLPTTRRKNIQDKYPAVVGSDISESSANLKSRLDTYVRLTKHEESNEILGKYSITRKSPITGQPYVEEKFVTVLTKLGDVDYMIHDLLEEIELRQNEEMEEARHQANEEDPYTKKSRDMQTELKKAMDRREDGAAVLLYSPRAEEEEFKIANDPARAFDNTPSMKLQRELGRELERASVSKRTKIEKGGYKTSDELDNPILPQRDVSAAAFDEISDSASRLLHQDNYQTAKLAKEYIEAKGGYTITTIFDRPPRTNDKSINANAFSTAWEASFNYNAGIMTAELTPDWSTPNVNGFFLHESLKEKLMDALNSGRIFIRDAHSRAIKDIIGVVKRATERDGRIIIKGDITDSKVSEVLEKYPNTLGVSLGGSGIGYCEKCNRKVMGMQRCPDHPKASIVVKEFDLKEVSITDSPAWSTSKVLKYEKGETQ